MVDRFSQGIGIGSGRVGATLLPSKCYTLSIESSIPCQDKTHQFQISRYQRKDRRRQVKVDNGSYREQCS